MPFSPEKRRAYDAARTDPGRHANRNAARTARRAVNTTTFVGVDGEGVTRPDGTHDYVLLSMGDQSLHHPDGGRLTTEEIFAWMWQNHRPGTAYVGFFLGYDLSQWLKDLPEERARMLLTDAGHHVRRRVDANGNPIPHPVRWKQWEFDILPNMKRFKLRPAFTKLPWLVICDSGPMFQCSFLKAIDPGEWPVPVCSAEEYALVKAGKADRGVEVVEPGTPVDPEMVRYNVLENDLLARLMTRTNEGLAAMGVKLQRTQWYGPGQAAQEWLKLAAGDATRESILSSAEERGVLEQYEVAFDAARCAYFGGWFEIMAHGPVPGVTWEYDINSAYPHIIAGLPCLLHGEWTSGSFDSSPWRLVRASVRGSDAFIGAMLHRTPSGGVLRPWETSGWYWAHELTAAIEAGLVEDVEYHESWTYRPCPCKPPFASIADLYRQRIEVGKNTPQGKALKLVYNSAYGKMAQSVGLPKFSNAVYASLVTAGCRTMILQAIATHPRRSAAVVMVATDGIYFTERHPTLSVDPGRLGLWEEGQKTNLCLFKPGVYWDDATRQSIKKGGRLKLKSRGVNERALAKVVGQLDRQWTGFDQRRELWNPLGWPSAQLAIPFALIPPKQALNRRKWELCGTVDHGKSVVQSALPHRKRALQAPPNPPDGLIRTSPYPRAKEGVASTPYEQRFGMELKEAQELGGVETPDGPLQVLFNEVFH